MSELYHVRRLFTLGLSCSGLVCELQRLSLVTGAYSTLISVQLPEPSSEDYTSILLYQARAHIALNDAASALAVLPANSSSVAVKAVRALAQSLDDEAALETLRDLCVEIEGDDAAADEKEKSAVRVAAATAFARAGETEEALETLGAGTPTEDLDACAAQPSPISIPHTN